MLKPQERKGNYADPRILLLEGKVYKDYLYITLMFFDSLQ